MNRTKTAFVAFAVSQLALAAAIVLAYSVLPERVATHFGAAGVPDGWMSRTAHLWAMCGIGFGFSFFTIGIFYAIRFFPPSTINLPQRDYWMAAERRSESFDFMFRSGVWLASLQSLFLVVLHLLVVAANRTDPARLSSVIWLVTACFVVVIVVWAISIIRRFQRSGPTHPSK